MISNQTQLYSIINNALITVVDNTMERALDELLKIIDKIVYSYPATWTNGYDGSYGRTEEFRDSWDKTKAKFVASFSGSAVEASILQTLSLSYHPPFSHGSIANGAINKDDLNDIIVNGLNESHMNFPAIAARPFWTEFELWCNQNLRDIFVQECQKVGLNVKANMSFSFT